MIVNIIALCLSNVLAMPWVFYMVQFNPHNDLAI